VRLDVVVGERKLRAEVRRTDVGYAITLDGSTLDVDFLETGDRFASLLVEGRSYEMGVEGRDGQYRIHLPNGTLTVGLAEASRDGAARPPRSRGPEGLTAPMPGRVVRVLVAEGDDVGAGQGLVVIEAMKMENELRSPRQGRVREVAVREGQAVEAGALLVVVG
jgi:biotin carboxyl carrier protein